MNRAVFLDRDGTINREVNYLHKPEDFIFIPGAIQAIRIFRQLGFKVVVITNQSGVARGYYQEKDVIELHGFIDGLLTSAGTKVDRYYYCPHHPDGTVSPYAVTCNCRKPKPGMIESAATELNLDLSRSILVGDTKADIEAGERAGVGITVLVRSGHPIIDESSIGADQVANDVHDFALHIWGSAVKKP